jgi:hypothetical protein
VVAVPVETTASREPAAAPTAAGIGEGGFDSTFDRRTGGPRPGGNASVPTRARVIIRTAEYWRKVIERVRTIFRTADAGLRRWWAWTDRPPSLRACWRLSRVDEARVPRGDRGLTAGWTVANGIERLLVFALLLVAPSFAQPLLRWCVMRPTRRAGLWLALILLVAVALISRWSA